MLLSVCRTRGVCDSMWLSGHRTTVCLCRARLSLDDKASRALKIIRESCDCMSALSPLFVHAMTGNSRTTIVARKHQLGDLRREAMYVLPLCVVGSAVREVNFEGAVGLLMPAKRSDPSRFDSVPVGHLWCVWRDACLEQMRTQHRTSGRVSKTAATERSRRGRIRRRQWT